MNPAHLLIVAEPRFILRSPNFPLKQIVLCISRLISQAEQLNSLSQVREKGCNLYLFMYQIYGIFGSSEGVIK